MKLIVICVLLIGIICSIGISQPVRGSYHFAYQSEKAIAEAVSEESETGIFSYVLKAALNKAQVPEIYHTNLLTSVCETGQCYLIRVNIFWDLTGSFIGYSMPGKEILTKLDHEPFNTADYQKLDRILKDQQWPLADYPISELVIEGDHDHEIVDRKNTTAPTEVELDLGNNKLFDLEVDAYTGATAPFVTEEDNISGALYTIYTLWDFIYDPNIIASLQKYTSSLIETDSLQLTDLLSSKKPTYWKWAIQRLDNSSVDQEINSLLIDIVEQADQYISYEALTLIDASHATTQKRLWESFKLAPVHKKKDLVDKLLSVIIDKETLIEITNYREEVANPMERYLVSKLVNNNR